MSPYQLVLKLVELKGHADAGNAIAEYDTPEERIFEKMSANLADLIDKYKNNHCCSEHFVKGGVCNLKAVKSDLGDYRVEQN